jgi:6-phosphogluconolactonase
MNYNLEIVEPKLFAGAVADEIVACINDAIGEQGRCRVALAGGSTPGAVYRMIAKPPRVTDVEWDKVDFFFGDERWVAHSDHQSNCKMAQETLLAHIAGKHPGVFPVDTGLSTPEEGARAYAHTMREVFGIGGADTPIFDLVLLGVGEDGHTASLFPGSPLVDGEGDDICAAVPHPAGDCMRVTLTPKVILAARRVTYIVTGAAKSPVVKRILQSDASVSELPATIFRNAAGKVSWFVDSPAGQGLR